MGGRELTMGYKGRPSGTLSVEGVEVIEGEDH